MADVHTGLAIANNLANLQPQRKGNYTRKYAVKPAKALKAASPAQEQAKESEPRAPLVKRYTLKQELALTDLKRARNYYKDQVANGACVIHSIFTGQSIKHDPFFNCPIRPTLLCNRCHHKGHLTGECLLIDSHMKAEAKGAAIGSLVQGKKAQAPWHGAKGDYNSPSSFELIEWAQPKKAAAPIVKKLSPAKPIADYTKMTTRQLFDVLKDRKGAIEKLLKKDKVAVGWLRGQHKDAMVNMALKTDPKA